MKRRHLLAACSLLTASVLCTAQPSTPTQVIVPAPPGGPSDLIARIVIGRLQAKGGVYVIENKSGANGMIAARGVSESFRDAHWMVGDATLLTSNPLLYPQDQGFNIERDIVAVAGLLRQPSVLVVGQASPWKSMGDLIEAAKKRSVSFASGGVGSNGHLTMGRFGDVAGFTPLHVPYKGAAPAMVDLIGGRVDAAFVLVSGVAEYIKTGKLRALAVASDTRLAFAPEVPTIAEAGLPQFRGEGAYFLMMAARAPEPEKEKVGQRMREAIADPQVQKQLVGLGLIPDWMPAEKARNWIAEERARNARFIADNKVGLEK